jgi:hypothetical protein
MFGVVSMSMLLGFSIACLIFGLSMSHLNKTHEVKIILRTSTIREPTSAFQDEHTYAFNFIRPDRGMQCGNILAYDINTNPKFTSRTILSVDLTMFGNPSAVVQAMKPSVKNQTCLNEKYSGL